MRLQMFASLEKTALRVVLLFTVYWACAVFHLVGIHITNSLPGFQNYRVVEYHHHLRYSVYAVNIQSRSQNRC